MELRTTPTFLSACPFPAGQPNRTQLIALLQTQRSRGIARVSRLMTRLAPLTKSDDWVFANPETGKPFWPGRIQENWLVPAAEKAGIGRIGWHTFRHSHSTLASCAQCRSPDAARAAATRRYSNDHEYLHSGGSDCIATGKQQSRSFGFAGASRLTDTAVGQTGQSIP
jgi:hypothetical protein